MKQVCFTYAVRLSFDNDVYGEEEISYMDIIRKHGKGSQLQKLFSKFLIKTVPWKLFKASFTYRREIKASWSN